MCTLFIIVALSSGLNAEILGSGQWGFQIDPPEEFEFVGGDQIKSFEFESPDGIGLTLMIYTNVQTVDATAADIQRRLNNQGQSSFFNYQGKRTAIFNLRFQNFSGWGLCVPLDPPDGTTALLLVLAYGDARRTDLEPVYLSILDSVVPTPADRLAPGPVTAWNYPQTRRVSKPLFGTKWGALVYDNDERAAQAVVDREHAVMLRYLDSPEWQRAWTRFYRMIYRDSFERLSSIAFIVERTFYQPDGNSRGAAERVLNWVQTFRYERDPQGSDFVNVVTAALEGRGDCDSRALLWAIILEHQGIPAAIMVSRSYSHAMGLVDVPGEGARFPLNDKHMLVAEPISQTAIGRIDRAMSDQKAWLGISFEN
ncbi:hypothetical protein FACS1894172_01400 [Spirochaetia bacterium]|nr:hypothetical protein FACS1894164_04780 [Spirochaetia bacterium]GHU29708.1 hypothetical protein FACS1894172_01400 [Spirochaetia bacterium]